MEDDALYLTGKQLWDCGFESQSQCWCVYCWADPPSKDSCKNVSMIVFQKQARGPMTCKSY